MLLVIKEDTAWLMRTIKALDGRKAKESPGATEAIRAIRARKARNLPVNAANGVGYGRRSASS
jgi:hypothetical protein